MNVHVTTEYDRSPAMSVETMRDTHRTNRIRARPSRSVPHVHRIDNLGFQMVRYGRPMHNAWEILGRFRRFPS
jgi:hypothetical protein